LPGKGTSRFDERSRPFLFSGDVQTSDISLIKRPSSQYVKTKKTPTIFRPSIKDYSPGS
jgi:hypothetical protein